MFLWTLNFSSVKTEVKDQLFQFRLFYLSFSNTPLAHFPVNITSPLKSFKRVGLFALITCSQGNALYLFYHTWVCLQTFFNTFVLTIFVLFFPAIYCYSNERILRNFLAVTAILKSLACVPTSFLIFSGRPFTYFLGHSYDFCISSLAKASSAEIIFSVAVDRTWVIWIPSVSILVFICSLFIDHDQTTISKILKCIFKPNTFMLALT